MSQLLSLRGCRQVPQQVGAGDTLQRLHRPVLLVVLWVVEAGLLLLLLLLRVVVMLLVAVLRLWPVLVLGLWLQLAAARCPSWRLQRRRRSSP